ncbi:MAG: recombination regulator RecX [Burkholderiaceae bacterium]|nr:recombination regulator RecX [Burkholderiaceae bacterium]
MVFNALSLKGRALRLLGQREHSRAELERKLAPHVQEGEDLDAVLRELEAKGFIDAARVVDSVLHQNTARWGTGRLRQALRAKGIDPEAVQAALAPLQDSELDRARALWLRKFGTPPTEAKERARQMRFLAARGFSGEVVRRVLQGTDGD